MRLGNFLLAVLFFAVCRQELGYGQDIIEFESYFGGPGSDGATSLIDVSDGGFLLGGWKTREGVPGVIDGWLVRVDARGRYLWDLPLTTNGERGILALSPSLDGGFLTASPDAEDSGATRLSKISPTGVLEWSETIAGRGQFTATALQPTLDGGVIMAGYVGSGENTDGLILKLDRANTVQWFRSVQSEGASAYTSIHMMLTGDIVGVGWTKTRQDKRLGWATKLSPLGATMWERSYTLAPETRVERILSLDDGSFIFLANGRDADKSASNMIIGRLGNDGTLVWQKNVRATGSATGHDLERQTNGSFLASASIQDDGGNNGLVVRFTPNGTVTSFYRHIGSGDTHARAVIDLGLEGYAVAGVAESSDDLNSEMWIAVRRSLTMEPTNSQELEP